MKFRDHFLTKIIASLVCTTLVLSPVAFAQDAGKKPAGEKKTETAEKPVVEKKAEPVKKPATAKKQAAKPLKTAKKQVKETTVPKVVAAPAKPKKSAVFGPFLAEGKLGTENKDAIIARLESTISKVYNMLPRAKYLAAEKTILESRKMETCKTQECYRLVQELLRVDTMFLGEVKVVDEAARLSVSIIKYEDKKVAVKVCPNCTPAWMESEMELLAKQLIGEDLKIDVEQAIAEADKLSPMMTPPPTGKEPRKFFGLPWYYWAAGGGAVLLLALMGGGGGDGGDDTGSVAVTW